MSTRPWLSLVAAGAIGLFSSATLPLAASLPSSPAPEGGTSSEPVDDPLDALEDETPAATPVTGRPFTARIAIDSSTPINYGDDVVVSIWVTPSEGIELQDVRLQPKGALASIYRSAERAPADPLKPGVVGKATISGVPCRNDLLNRPAGIPFVVSCRLTSYYSGWQRWFDTDALIGSGKQQIEAQIVLQQGVDGEVVYYESADVSFVSPKSAVILGGFFGALLWAVFLTISQPVSTTQSIPVKTWRDVFGRVRGSMPQATFNAGEGSWRILRSSLLGCAVALVLIVMAQSTEGFEPPISIRIQDFWGGMMVGILSVPLAKWIRGKLGTDL